MKIKTITTTTEIECNAEELRQSNSVSDSILGALRRAFNGPLPSTAYTAPKESDEEEENDEEEDEEEE